MVHETRRLETDELESEGAELRGVGPAEVALPDHRSSRPVRVGALDHHADDRLGGSRVLLIAVPRLHARNLATDERHDPVLRLPVGALAPPRGDASLCPAPYVTSQVVGCGWSIRGLPSIGTRKNTTPSSTGSAVSFRPTWMLEGSSTNASPGS